MSWLQEICEKMDEVNGVKKMEKAMLSLISEMIKDGCNPNKLESENEKSPIWISLLKNDEVPVSIIKYFLEHGAKVPKETNIDEPLLFTAMEHGMDPGVIALLVEHGADASFIADDNATALHYACSKGKYELETIKLLVEHGCPVDLIFEDFRLTPLSFACGAESDIEVLRYLIQNGADVNVIDHEGDSPLMRICYWSYSGADKLSLLLENGAILNIKNHEGYSALGILCKGFGDPEMIQVLSENGMNVDTLENGYSMLMLAVEADNWEAVERLILLGFTKIDVVHSETGETVFDLVKEESELEKLNNLLGR